MNAAVCLCHPILRIYRICGVLRIFNNSIVPCICVTNERWNYSGMYVFVCVYVCICISLYYCIVNDDENAIVTLTMLSI